MWFHTPDNRPSKSIVRCVPADICSAASALSILLSVHHKVGSYTQSGTRPAAVVHQMLRVEGDYTATQSALPPQNRYPLPRISNPGNLLLESP